MGLGLAGTLGMIGLATSGIGGLVGAIGGSRDQTYDPTINPYTGQAYNALQGYAGQAWNQMQGYQLPTYEGNMAALQGSMPGLMDITSQIMGQYGPAAFSNAGLMAQQNRLDVSNQFADLGAVQSGAALSALARGTAQPYAQAMQNVAGMQAQLGGNIVGGAWGGIQNLNQLGMQQQGLYANILGGALSGMGQIGNPAAWPQPSIVQGQGNPWGNFLSGFGGLLTGVGAMDWGNTSGNTGLSHENVH